jgi:phenylalanyl-tRNA synthetase beta chain
MKVSYNLLQKYLVLEGKNPNALAPAIAEHCFEVEHIQQVGAVQPEFSNVFAAKVIKIEKHPNADRLRIVSVDIGKQIINPVVCGANNFEAGDMVCLALPGARIPQDIHSESHQSFILSSAKIRGIESQGMICSAFELGLRPTPEEKPEILVLPKAVMAGTNLVEYFGQQASAQGQADFLIDFSLPANRPDLHSHLGIARELSGMLGIKTTKQFLQAQKEMSAVGGVEDFSKQAPLKKYVKKSKLSVEIKTAQCTAYAAVRMSVRVGPTPPEILLPLKTLGHDGVNNIVDITNYVMVEIGQPLHAFDASAVQDGHIIVRSASEKEQLKALDGNTYSLPEHAVVIADGHKALALGGVIGGDQSKILDTTKEIILEAALFDGISVRRTSKKIGLRTDASSLFEKGSSIEQLVQATLRAVELLQKHAGAEVLEVYNTPFLKLKKSPAINFTAEELNNLLGSNFSAVQIKKTLASLGIPVSGSKKLSATLPWYRKDIEDAAGLANEMIRFSGMNLVEKQPLVLERGTMQYSREASIWQAKEATALLGYSEVQGYSFISAAEIQAAKRDPAEYIKISNPLSSETEYLRQNLAEGLLKIVGLNAKHSEAFKLFEIGYGYFGYEQEPLLAALAIYKKQFSSEINLAELKGDVKAFLQSLGLNGQISWQQGEGNISTIFYSADAQSPKQSIGAVNIVGPTHSMAKRVNLENEVLICQLALDILFTLSKKDSFKQFSRFPTSSLDLSIVVAEDVPWKKIEDIVWKNGGEFLQDLTIIDAPYLYAKNSLPQFHKNLLKEARKNLVFRLTFAASDRTLKDSEFSGNYAKIKERLTTDLKAEIR